MKERAFLFMEAGRRVYRCQFTRPLTVIGSADDNDIVIRDASVEPQHAQISRAADAYTLRPLHDSDVRIDGEPVDSARELANGDRIEVGDTEMLFVREQRQSPTTVHLIIRKGDEPPMGFWTSRATITIGRERGDIIIDDPLLSKVHAIVENFCENGHFVIDARSERGTGLNGESLDARHRLRDGDVISLGSVTIEFRSQPFETPSGRDAGRLAAGRPSVRDEAAVPAIPRNPNQRYADGGGLPPVDPGPRRRSGRLDIRSGVTTGIVDTGVRARPARQRPVEPPRREPDQWTAAPRRPGTGRVAPGGAGFGDRPSEMATRVADARTRDGLWYLPDRAEDEPRERPRIRRPERPRSLTGPPPAPVRAEPVPRARPVPRNPVPRGDTVHAADDGNRTQPAVSGGRYAPQPGPSRAASRGGGAWYLPGSDDRNPPSRRQPPVNEGHSSHAARSERARPERKSSKTQVFDGSDY